MGERSTKSIAITTSSMKGKNRKQIELLVEHVGLVTEKTEVAYLKSFPCIVVKKTFQVTSSYFAACRHLRDDDFAICPTHRCWVESWFQ